MPLYAAAATLGSVLGCILLYYIARKGGEAFFEKNAGVHGPTVRHWVEQNGFVGMLLAALLPPPTPFKVFVFAAGVFEVPVGSFTLAIFIARVLRYFTVGYSGHALRPLRAAVSRPTQTAGSAGCVGISGRQLPALTPDPPQKGSRKAQSVALKNGKANLRIRQRPALELPRHHGKRKPFRIRTYVFIHR